MLKNRFGSRASVRTNLSEGHGLNALKSGRALFAAKSFHSFFYNLRRRSEETLIYNRCGFSWVDTKTHTT
jgi:hypothetical protein